MKLAGVGQYAGFYRLADKALGGYCPSHPAVDMSLQPIRAIGVPMPQTMNKANGKRRYDEYA